MLGTGTLVFIEFPEQVPAGVAAMSGHRACQVIALTPHAAYRLERERVPFCYPEEFFDERKLEEFGVGNFPRLEAFCAYVDSYLQQRVPGLREAELQPAWFHFYYLKILFDAITMRLYELDAILQATLPAQIIYFAPHEPSFFKDDLVWSSNESVYSHVLRLVCTTDRIPHMELPFAYDTITSTLHQSEAEALQRLRPRGLWPAVRRRLRGSPIAGLYRATRRVEQRVVRRLGHLIAPTRRTGFPLLFIHQVVPPEHFHGVADVWYWGEDGGTPTRLTPPYRALRSVVPRAEAPVAEDLKHCWRALRAEPELRQFFRFGRWDWFEIVAERLRHLVEHIAYKVYVRHEEARHWLAAIHPYAVCAACLMSYPARAVAHAARRSGVPVICQYHGGLGHAYFPYLYYLDMVATDWFLLYGEGSCSYVERYYDQVTRPIAVGSPALDSLCSAQYSRPLLCHALGLNPDKPVVLFVPTNLDGNWRYASYRIPSDRTQFRWQRRVVEIFSHHPHVQLVIKGHGAPNNPASPFREVVRPGKSPNVRYISQLPFNRLLALADCFIIDSPSTTILEALTTDAPIYVYNAWFRWEAEALELLRRRAVVKDDLDAFCQRLDEDLRTGRAFERRLWDDSYLRVFGDPFRDGDSARWTARAILQIADIGKAGQIEPRANESAPQVSGETAVGGHRQKHG